MQPMESFEVSLPADIIASMNDAVAHGEYPTQDDIVRAALMQWKMEHDQPLQNIEHLRALWDEGIASGRSSYTSASEILAKVIARKDASSPGI